MPETPAAEADIEAMIDSIARKMTVELGAKVARLSSAIAIRYPTPLEYTWPRAVAVSLEILGPGLEASASAGASLGEPHLAHVFGCDVQADARAIDAAGYDSCWNVQTLALDLGQVQTHTAEGLAIERVERREQLAELNAIEPDYRSYEPSLGRDEFVDLLGRRDGQAVAKGQIVCVSPDIAYVADMFTAPVARKAGYGSALLSALHAEARLRGRTRAVLIPSLMAAEARFYERHGYQRVSLDAMLLSKA